MITACGVLPISVHNGDIYVLCGRERVVNGWDGSGRFAGFGGMKEEGESNRRCGARECYEESMGFFGSEDDIFKKLSKKSDYYLGAVDSGIYRSYWLRHDHDLTLPPTYQNVYKYLKQTNCMTDNAIKHGYFEKTDLRYYKLSTLLSFAKSPDKYTRKMFRPNFLEQIKLMVDTNPLLVYSVLKKYK
jgi:hypothetical protein